MVIVLAIAEVVIVVYLVASINLEVLIGIGCCIISKVCTLKAIISFYG